jgi:hypothetical protein
MFFPKVDNDLPIVPRTQCLHGHSCEIFNIYHLNSRSFETPFWEVSPSVTISLRRMLSQAKGVRVLWQRRLTPPLCEDGKRRRRNSVEATALSILCSELPEKCICYGARASRMCLGGGRSETNINMQSNKKNGSQSWRSEMQVYGEARLCMKRKQTQRTCLPTWSSGLNIRQHIQSHEGMRYATT